MVERTDGDTGDQAGQDTRDAGSVGFNPADYKPAGNDSRGSDGFDDPPRKRRGRPPGSGTGAKPAEKTAKVPFDISGLETLLLSIHTMLAVATDNATLGISPDEAKILATAAAKVQRHYPINTSAVMLDWSNLVIAMLTVYGTRFMALRMQAKGKPEIAQQNITPFPFAMPGA